MKLKFRIATFYASRLSLELTVAQARLGVMKTMRESWSTSSGGELTQDRKNCFGPTPWSIDTALFEGV